jgi:hypothetical protein
MDTLHPKEPLHRKRSPFLIAAWCTLSGAFILLLLGTGALWVLAGIGMAVLLALADLFLKLRRL